ncbi:MAG: hypothetical protein GXY15_15450 [Candidatus Hydrogenedentes bacterium]|nr:hypothetical protein [Candidatus Hydrogenedentota bacterium]
MNHGRLGRRGFLRGMATAAALGAAGGMAAAAEPSAPRPMKVILWCWDARMTWDDEPEAVSRKMAASEQAFPYGKRPESFLTGFKRLVDYAARIGVHAVIVWGFLRDAHGGVKAAKELAAYARDHGVAILPGVGLCAYGGYYYEGDHPFNLATYLRKHPERASTAFEDGGGREVAPVLDPSLAENQAWWRDGLEWMLETFAIGGVNYEMGDFIVNPSESAVRARAGLGFETNGNLMDCVVATRGLLRHALAAKPDGLFINSTYRGYHRIASFPAMPYVDAVPPGTVWQYTLDEMVRKPGFPEEFAGAPEHRRYGYLHWFNTSTRTVDRDYAADIARVYPGAARLGFEFIGTYGELGINGNPAADRNYRAQTAWAQNPALALEDFA